MALCRTAVSNLRLKCTQISGCHNYCSAAPDNRRKPNESKNNFIGLPDKVSNLRPVIYCHKNNETALERRLRESQEDVQIWNQEFWSKHNASFIKEREAFIAANLPKGGDGSTLSADKMSVFYKSFLDKNWSLHTNYNIQWYKKNIGLLILSVRINVSNLIFRGRM